jgi:UPF0755 protein
VTADAGDRPPGSRRPRGSQPQAPGPQEPLPPGYRPVHHDAQSSPPRRDRGSPWRRAQQVSGEFYSPDDAHGGDPDDDAYGDQGEYPPQQDDGYDALLGHGDDLFGSAEPSARPRRKRRRFRWLAPWVAVLVILVPLAVGGYYAYSFYRSKFHPPDYSGSGTGYIVVQVPSGATPTSLGPKLQGLGVVASSRAFVLAAEHSSNPNGLLPGFYGMHRHMQASLAYALLLNPKDLVQVPVTIPEGFRNSQVVAWLGAKSGISASAYASVLSKPALLHLPSYANGNPEGYLFPATYDVVPHESALQVLTAMVQRFDQEAAAVNLPAAASQAHLTVGQVIIMASLVQAEGGRLADYPKIARVIDNRLALGMPLQLDSTVLFGLNTFGILATDQQLQSDSPYNTYRHKGLPPGPIDNPGNAAIQAVLHPASGPWLYFVTVNPKTRETLFTSSAAQFAQFKAELEKNLGQG